MSEDLRGVFFIVKGQYEKGVEPSFVNKAKNEVSWLGGYDPELNTTKEWYMCLDNITFNCVACGGDIKKVVKGVYNTITKYKDLKHYLHHISKTTSDDTYEQRYLGHPPLTHDQRVKKAEGRCPRVSPPMRCLYKAVYDEYGDYYSDLVKEMEDLAYSDIKDKTPFRKAKKLAKTKTLTSPQKKVIKKSSTLNKVDTLKTHQNTTKVIKPKGVKKIKKLSV